MEFQAGNWQVLCVVALLAIGVVIGILRFMKMSASERKEMIMGWLLQAVVAAEKEFGSKTGELKLSYVYDKFCERFPKFSHKIPFSVFRAYVDAVLEELRNLVEKNEAIASVIEQKD